MEDTVGLVGLAFRARAGDSSSACSGGVSEHRGGRNMFSNLTLAVYTVLKQCLSASMFCTLLMFDLHAAQHKSHQQELLCLQEATERSVRQ